ncbi:MAG: 23S rRNA (pseudouridine(1915)-N(3))-methyltransferase RlmH, partial [Pseudomonadota bacterium]
MKPGPERALFDLYRGRFDALAAPLGLRPLRERGGGPTKAPRGGDARRAAESAWIVDGCAPGGVLIALDERGTSIASRRLAEAVGRWRDEGVKEATFALGGADGHSQALRNASAEIWSFGAATWPHMLARVMLAEQL